VEAETFIRNGRDEHDIVGTTYLDPAFSLGTVNIGDLWNQRRPLIAYWTTPAGPAALRLRCLHDNYDYASAGLFTIQDEADVLAAVLFATDRGDTHISLDKIRNATIEVRDLRIRLQFEGALGDLALPVLTNAGTSETHEPVSFTCGSVTGAFCIHSAEFDSRPVHLETGRDADAAWIDVILYSGPSRQFNFAEIEQAATVLTLSLTANRKSSIVNDKSEAPPSVHMTIATDVLAGDLFSPREIWTWQRTNRQPLALTIPVKPLPTKEQKAATAAKSGAADPWKST
jgi:hypothetical protein